MWDAKSRVTPSWKSPCARWPPSLCKSGGGRPELGDGKLPGSRLQRGDGIIQFHRRHRFAQTNACAVRIREGACMPRILLDDNKRWQLLIAVMNGAQQCHSMAIFTKSHDSEIQLAPSLTGNL